MNVAESIQLATEWVWRYAASNPDFRGAHLMGGITSLHRGALFPETSDLDVGVLVQTPPKPGLEVIDECYRGIAIEAGLRSIELYRSPDAVLANPELASSLAVDSIVADPYRLLAGIQPVVSAEYGRSRWVIARCDVEKHQAIAALGRAAGATTAAEFLPEMVWVLVYLSGLITVASLQPPTHRKCLVLLRELLCAQGRADLYEETLAIAGCAHLNPMQVTTYAQQTDIAFDRAVEARRTPVPFDFKLQPHLRPYLSGGTHLMIEQGHHREAMPWICMGLWLCTGVIRNDASASESAQFDRIWNELFELLGIATPASRSEKVHQAIEVKDSLFALADEITGGLSDETPMAAVTG